MSQGVHSGFQVRPWNAFFFIRTSSIGTLSLKFGDILGTCNLKMFNIKAQSWLLKKMCVDGIFASAGANLDLCRSQR